MFDRMLLDISHIRTKCGDCLETSLGLLSVPQTIVMDLNNVMVARTTLTIQFSIPLNMELEVSTQESRTSICKPKLSMQFVSSGNNYFLDFHSGCVVSAGLVVVWVLFAIEFSVCTKKEEDMETIIEMGFYMRLRLSCSLKPMVLNW